MSFDDPYTKYLSQMKELRRYIDTGLGDSQEACLLRHEMNKSWKLLSKIDLENIWKEISERGTYKQNWVCIWK